MIRLPRALLWDHNAHYHGWLLRQLPERGGRVLDVGCGAGQLVGRIAGRVDAVDAVDLSADMIDHARASLPGADNVRWLIGDVLDPGLDLHPAGYDAVTAVASLHHMPLRPALERFAELVRPGGVLAVVGLYRSETPADFATEALALPANAAMGAYLAVRGRAGKPHADRMPVQTPTTTLRELRAATAATLPGSDLRRCLFWRYRLRWRKP
ncbi:SAM-dependent methyltransferase [Saccharopolyspora subtropica]|uniref:SAM-dependent methyltransferase n=1 Tax=Saccharopolyspora thermophila TaxID=89367 RepID=A0A917NAE2_9PSEU|nr:class I SAM-dependent methyltransferase [Saccharopolyspora subtropica]GGI77720.1 SAM-dependent methyltransferase [Saccharopolyspora subtropica]